MTYFNQFNKYLVDPTDTSTSQKVVDIFILYYTEILEDYNESIKIYHEDLKKYDDTYTEYIKRIKAQEYLIKSTDIDNILYKKTEHNNNDLYNLEFRELYLDSNQIDFQLNKTGYVNNMIIKHLNTVWLHGFELPERYFDVCKNNNNVIKNMFLLDDEFTPEHEKIYKEYEQSKKRVKELIGGKSKKSLHKFKFTPITYKS